MKSLRASVGPRGAHGCALTGRWVAATVARIHLRARDTFGRTTRGHEGRTDSGRRSPIPPIRASSSWHRECQETRGMSSAFRVLSMLVAATVSSVVYAGCATSAPADPGPSAIDGGSDAPHESGDPRIDAATDAPNEAADAPAPDAACTPSQVPAFDGTTWNNAAGAGVAGVAHASYTSAVMCVEIGYNIYLPPEYASQAAERFPVLYFLHGRGGDENADVAKVMSHYAGAAHFLVVFPNGGRNSKYRDAVPG